MFSSLLFFYCLSLLAVVIFANMDKVRQLGVDLNAPVSESVVILSSCSISQLLSVRSALFDDTVAHGLTCEGDVLVSRRDSRKNSLNSKLIGDISILLSSLKNNSSVRRSVLKNGKRSRRYLDASRAANHSLSTSETQTSSSSQSQVDLTVHPTMNSLSDSVRASVFMHDINSLKNDINVGLVLIVTPFRNVICSLHQRVSIVSNFSPLSLSPPPYSLTVPS